MKLDLKTIALIAGLAAVVVFASNNDLPIIGNTVRRALS